MPILKEICVKSKQMLLSNNKDILSTHLLLCVSIVSTYIIEMLYIYNIRFLVQV